MEFILEKVQAGWMVLWTIFTNEIFYTALLAWFVAQLIKVIIHLITKRKFDFRLFVGTGGMPSSHSAAVIAGTTMFGLHYGWESGPFLVSLLYCVVVVNDAMGVRRAAGNQARVLNKMIDDLEHHELKAGKRLKELLGHTPLEIFAGIFIGITVAIISFYA